MASFSDLRESIIFQNFTFLISLIIFLRLFYKDALKKWIPLSSIYIFNINLFFDFYHNFLSQMESSYQKLSFLQPFFTRKITFPLLKSLKPRTKISSLIYIQSQEILYLYISFFYLFIRFSISTLQYNNNDREH